MQQILSYVHLPSNNYFSTSDVNTPLQALSRKAKHNSQRPLSKLQFILLLIIKEDCSIQEYSNRTVPELAFISGHSIDGVKKALGVLNKRGYVLRQKQTRGYATVRAITPEGLLYKPDKFRRNNKKAQQKAPQSGSTLYKISSPEQDQQDLLPRDSISKTLKREEECFRALEYSELDESIVVAALKRSHLTLETRFSMANAVMAAHYKKLIQYKRAYYLTAIDNQKEINHARTPSTTKPS